MKHVKIIDLLSLATGWDTTYMTENPEKVVDVIKEIKLGAYALGINGGSCRIEDIKEYSMKNTMTEDTSPENLYKFLFSEDPTMRLTGISMAKGVYLPESNKIVKALSYWDTDEKVKDAANESKEDEKDNPEDEALYSFDDCPLWMQIYHIKNASNGYYWPDALDYDATQFYELIVEMTSGKLTREAKREILNCLEDEWKAHTWYISGKDPKWGGGTYELAQCIINLNEDLKSKIINDACQVIAGIAEDKYDTLREGFSTDESNEGYPEDYFNIIAMYGSKDDGNCMFPLLVCEDEDVIYTAASALENLGMTKEELEELGYEE